MFFLTPRYVKHGRQYVKDARKLLAYKRDVVSLETVTEVEREIEALEKAVESRNETAIEAQAQKVETVCGKLTRPHPDAVWRENVEVFLVAIVIALGIRTYFLQPFTIPTGSMQPTLNGILGTRMETPPPNIIVRAFQGALYGRTYVNTVAKADEVIVAVHEIKSLLPFVERTPFVSGVGFFTRTEIITDQGNRYVIKESPDPVLRTFLEPRGLGHVYRKGEPVARGYFDTGDHVFVDKFTYHFRTPKRGEVFVFNTQKLPTVEARRNPDGPSQYYIKRLVGVPGDTLRVDPPRLYVNGQMAQGAAFERVMSGNHGKPNQGYEGYGNGSPRFLMPILRGPQDTFTIPPKHYFAMGDNSYNSSDSRDFGPVPQKNLMGRGIFVYWPFIPHWGLIK